MNKKYTIAIISIGVVALGGFYLKDSVLFGAIGCNYKITEIPVPSANAVNVLSVLSADAALDSRVDSVFNAIKAYQLNYIQTNNVYWQGLRTHNQPVEYGESIQPENLDCLPAGKTISWNGAGIVMNPPLPFQIEIHEYVTGKGDKGFQVFYYVQSNGKVYVKSKGYGIEEAQRTYGWQEVGKSYYTKE